MTPEALAAAMEATWPPAASWVVGPWRLREGAGGGKRVSAATVEGATVEGVWRAADIALAEGEMAAPLFCLRPQDGALDAALERRGYRVVDPVVIYAAPTDAFAPPPNMAAFAHWPPLHIATDLWAEAGIGPARLAVMQRVQGPKTVLLGRSADRAAGVAFVALQGSTAMLHALEVAPGYRRQGCAQNILRAAADWARGHGADTLALAVTEANAGARALYASQGMRDVGQYHYRQK